MRNLEKHKHSCALRNSTVNEEPEATTSDRHPTTAIPNPAPRINNTGGTAAPPNYFAKARASLPAPPPPSPPAPSAAINATAPTPTELRHADIRGQASENTVETSTSGVPVLSAETPRTVTCMRCHESLPFHLVPAHGPKCKGSFCGSSGKDHDSFIPSAAGTVSSSSPIFRTVSAPSLADGSTTKCTSSGTDGGGGSVCNPRPERLTGDRSASGAEGDRKEALSVKPLTSPGKTTITRPAATSPWGRGAGDISFRGNLPPRAAFLHTTGTAMSSSSSVLKGIGSIAASHVSGLHVPLSPPRSKNIETWSTRQVTSWLRENMRPPRADMISRFHDGGIDGAALLELTDRLGPPVSSEAVGRIK